MILISFGLLIVYTHRVAVTIQAGNVVADVVQDLERAIREVSTQRVVDPGRLAAPQGMPEGNVEDLSARCDTQGAVLTANNSGYVQFIEHEELVIAALRAGVVVKMLVHPGQFVMSGASIARVLPATGRPAVERELLSAVRLGRHRTLRQDLEFGITQVVEVALRALSPAVNDTFTGLTCVDWLGEELRALALLPRSDWAWRLPDGRICLLEVPLTFNRMVKTAFDQIRQASKGNPAVTIRIFRALERLGTVVAERPQFGQALRAQVLALQETSAAEIVASVDRADIERAAQRALREIGEG
jgi:uncharacterized membrane protein